mmetsp:Transcript_88001/g.221458  ORF Transcript_88001/g.221458 Transcript_88001/m.221458 type:complete len:92 (-) Transcript_88001:247-522(-)
MRHRRGTSPCGSARLLASSRRPPPKARRRAPVVELALAWVVAMLPLQMGMVTEEGRAMAGATAMATAEGTATEGATGEATEEGMEEDMAAK